jgi:uncharacterized RDD family membrane protein YckC
LSEDRSPIGRVFGAIVPRAVDAVDPDALLDRLDVEAVVERIDVDALIGRVDVDGIIRRVDIDALLDRLDIDAVLDRVDIAKLLDRIDVDGLIKRVDLNALLADVDLNALLADVDLNALLVDVDLNALVGRLDVDALVARLDVDALLERVDVKALVAKAGIDEIVAEATTGVAARTLDLFRRQVVGLDLVIGGGVDRVMRRPRPDLAEVSLDPTGRPAGPVARILAFLADSALVSVLFSIAVAIGTGLFNLFTRDDFSASRGGGPWWAAAFLAWWFVYLWVSFEVAGATPGKALLGLRVRAVDGTALSGGRAAVRVLCYPISFVLALGLIPGVLRKDRRALHDLAAGSQEVVDWGQRQAEIPASLQRWVERNIGSEPAREVASTAT